MLIGDTQGDYEAAKGNNIPFIYASNGFGNVVDPVCSINSFEQILE